MISVLAGILILAATVVTVFVLKPKEGVEAAGWVHGVASGSTAALCLTGGLALGIALVLTGVLQ